jgi:periplasmic protein CpxP/Spy
MSSFTNRIATSGPVARSVAIAALMGATMLTSPLTAAHAGTSTNPAIQQAQATAPQQAATAGTAQTKVETVEQRITDLHTALNITPAQDSEWNAVAKAMRENAVAMDKLIADTGAAPQQNKTAVDDLKSYQEFAQAHVDGLKNLISSFGTLYDSMSDAQKKNADEVFATSGRSKGGAESHG